MKRKRKNYTAPEKVALLKRHLVDQVPVSTICDEAQLQPTVFYRWLKQFFENGAAALESANGEADRATVHAQRRVRLLEERLRTKDMVLAELMEEHVALKKSRGEH